MFLSIAHYDAKRRGGGKPREPNGRTRRAAAVSEYVVYFVYVPEAERFKVGQTRDIASRLKSYNSTENGEAFCHAQLVVETRQEALQLERFAIRRLAEDFPRLSLEWFRMAAGSVDDAVKSVVSASPVAIKLQRGLPGADDALSLAAEASKEANSAAAAYHRKRTRRAA